VDHGGKKIAGKGQFILDESPQMEDQKSQEGIETSGMDVRNHPGRRLGDRGGKGMENGNGQKAPFERGPEESGQDLNREKDCQERKIQEASQPVVTGIGVRNREAIGIGFGMKVMEGFLLQHPGKAVSGAAGVHVFETGEGLSAEGQVEPAKNKKGKEVSEIDVKFLEKLGGGFRKSQFLVVVEEEIGEDQKEKDEKVGPVPEPEANLPHGELGKVPVGVVESGCRFGHWDIFQGLSDGSVGFGLPFVVR